MVELKSDVTIADRQTVKTSVTIRDDGTARTIYVSSINRAFQTSGTNTLTIEGSAAGMLTLTVKEGFEGAAQPMLYAGSGTTMVLKNVAIRDYKNTSMAGSTSGVIYITSSGTKLSTVVLENVVMSGNSCNFDGQDIYLANNGILQIKNSSLTSGSGSTVSVYRTGTGSTLTLDGKVTAGIYTPAPIALADGFDAASQVSLYLDAYTDGKTVLTGTASVIAAAVNGGAVTLPEAADQPTETKLLETGFLSVAAPEIPEAYLYDASGTKVNEGSFADMVSAAGTGYIVELKGDIELAEKLVVQKTITIRDDGTARRILIGDNAQRGMDISSPSGTAASDYPTVTLQGTTGGGLSVQAKNPSTVFKYVAIYVIRAKLVVSGNVTVSDYQTNNKASNNANGGAISLASSGSLEADGLKVTNVTAAGKGAAIYSNGGNVTVKNASFSGNTSGSQDLYMNGGTLTIGGTVSGSVYTKTAIQLTDDFGTDSAISLYLDAYTDGKTVLTGTASVIAAAVNGGAVTLPEAANQPTETKLLETGLLSVAAEP